MNMKTRPILKKNLTIFILYHLFVFISLPIYFFYSFPSLGLSLATVALFFVAGMGVTAGYHRYYSHRSYKPNPFMEWVLLICGSLALQSSAYIWTHDHRLHHAHVDTDDDPYSINKGFWYAHFIWMLEKSPPFEPKVVSDLAKNPRVMFQHKHNLLFMFGSNGLMFLILGFLFNDFLGAFFIATIFRIFALHHMTWFINSLAHTWGDKPFCLEQTAVNNYVICLLTFGEGYHNYHHVFARDYRNGIRWFHFDPTKWLIWSMSKLGLAKNLFKVDDSTIQNKMIETKEALKVAKLASKAKISSKTQANI